MKPFFSHNQLKVVSPRALTRIKYGSDIDLNMLLNIDINAPVNESHKHTLLHLASGTSNLDNVRLLIENGAQVDSKNQFKDTPLHIAALHGRLNIVTYLVGQQNADVSMQNSQGKTAKDIAQKNEHADIVEYLTSPQNIESPIA